MKWIPVLSSVWLYRDSCNVYAVAGSRGVVIVNAGTGRWLEALDELPARPIALLCTHYFRDHSAGAVLASRSGIPVHVPEYERAIFIDPADFHRNRQTYIVYDNLWQHFAPIEGVPIAGVLRDYDTVRLAGLEFKIIPLPGATITQIGLGLRLANDQRVVFCGETIHSPGRLARLAPLQYDYQGLPGALNVYASAQRLREWWPDALLPSLGDPLPRDADEALAELQDTLRAVCAIREMVGSPSGTGMGSFFDAVHTPSLTKVTDHVWLSAHSCSNTWFLLSRSGKALAIDYGYNRVATALVAPAPERRRALLHGIEGLRAQFGIDRVDVVLVSHYHDDHVCGIPLLQRLFGTQCWAAESFADILAEPHGSAFPCTWPEPIRVDRRLSFDRKVQWEEYEFQLAPMSGHTRFSALIGFEADGKRFAHTGDQYFFYGPDGSMNLNDTSSQQWRRMPNHIYRNGAFLNSYPQSGRWLLDWRPDIVLQGHQPAFFTDENFFRHIEAWSCEYQALHQQAMPLSDGDAHFNVDSWAGWITPYRVHLKQPAPATVRVTVRNPFPRNARLEVRLIGIAGWRGTSATLDAEPRGEASCDLQITPDDCCRRQPFAMELVADGQPFGQVAEALMTVGSAEF